MYRVSAPDLLTSYRACKFTVCDYAERAVLRMKELKCLNNVIAFDEDEIRQKAKDADARYASKTERPLEGLLIGIKDNIDVQGKECTGASPAFAGCVAKRTATTVERLLAAGAIDTGRMNMHELAFGTTTTNQYFGHVHNFYNYDYNCGGSSGGSANAVAADVFPVALGTDTCGSIRIPASACGVYGYRPTIDVWPSDFGLKLCNLRDSVGPIASSMKTIALLDTVVAGNKHSAPEPSTARIGVPQDYFWSDLQTEIEAGCLEFLEKLEKAGFQIIRSPGPSPDLIRRSQGFVFQQIYREVYSLTRQFMDEHGMQNKSIQDVVSKIASPQVKLAMEHGMENPVTDGAYNESLKLRGDVKKAFEAYASEHKIDCWIFPTVKTPPQLLVNEQLSIIHNGREWEFFDLVLHNIATAAMVDQPGITMPCGRMPDSGVPFGIEIDALSGEDKKLIEIGLAIELSIGTTL